MRRVVDAEQTTPFDASSVGSRPRENDIRSTL